MSGENNAPTQARASIARNHEKVDAAIAGQTISGKRRGLKKIVSKTMEFTAQIPPDGEKVVTYKVHYSRWSKFRELVSPSDWRVKLES